MRKLERKIAVMGGTGTQGGSVVNALLAKNKFKVRVLTRNPNSDKAKALAAQGCEIVEGDLTKPATLESAFEGAYGAFLVTNFWSPDTGEKEYEQGTVAVKAAKAAGVQHLIWSTLPNCKEISGGKYEVIHFTGKALVDAEVAGADFPYYSFVEAPFYFQNLNEGFFAPQPHRNGGKVWTFPMRGDNKCIHVGDITELGKLVGRMFERPEKVGKGQHLALAAGVTSWQEMADTLNAQGHNITYTQMSDAELDQLPIPGGAKELRETMNFWEEYTYFGPNADIKIALARELIPEGFTSFAIWAKENMKP